MIAGGGALFFLSRREKPEILRREEGEKGKQTTQTNTWRFKKITLFASRLCELWVRRSQTYVSTPRRQHTKNRKKRLSDVFIFNANIASAKRTRFVRVNFDFDNAAVKHFRDFAKVLVASA